MNNHYFKKTISYRKNKKRNKSVRKMRTIRQSGGEGEGEGELDYFYDIDFTNNSDTDVLFSRWSELENDYLNTKFPNQSYSEAQKMEYLQPIYDKCSGNDLLRSESKSTDIEEAAKLKLCKFVLMWKIKVIKNLITMKIEDFSRDIESNYNPKYVKYNYYSKRANYERINYKHNQLHELYDVARKLRNSYFSIKEFK
jgi:hypothetical protein